MKPVLSLAFLLFLFALAPSRAGAQTFLYAGPTLTGAGNCTSPTNTCLITTAITAASAGATIFLVDGTYTGSASMINPPAGLSGKSGSPITIKAINDGKVFINGQGARQPIRLSSNSWFIIEGINAHNSGGSNSSTVQIDGSSTGSIIRRVVAWDCPATTNCTVMSINGGTSNLFEDVAAFGTGRKMFSFSQSGQSNSIIRRAWASWTRHTFSTPKIGFSIAYNSYGNKLESIIGTWKEEGSSHADGKHGILGNDQMFNSNPSADKCSNSSVHGAILYHRSTDTLASNYFGQLQSSSSMDCITLEHIATYEESATAKSAALNSLSTTHGGPSSGGHIVRRSTFVGGAAVSIGADWTQTSNSDVASVGLAPNLWNGSGSTGARFCKRYSNGVLTSEPIWPWPMEQRINDALKASGRNPVNYFRGTGNTVTSEQETIWGPIPAECRTGGIAAPDGLFVRRRN